MEVEEFRVLIKRCFLMGKTISETMNWLNKCYSTSNPSITTVQRWFTKFKRGDMSLQVGDRTGAPRFAVTQENVQKVQEMVLADRKIKIRELAIKMKISTKKCFYYFTRPPQHEKIVCEVGAAIPYD